VVVYEGVVGLEGGGGYVVGVVRVGGLSIGERIEGRGVWSESRGGVDVVAAGGVEHGVAVGAEDCNQKFVLG
jgi:hypothetical protein